MFCFYFFVFLSFHFNVVSKNIVDVIKEDPELSIFYSNLKKTGLEEILQKTCRGSGQFLHQSIRLLKSLPMGKKKKYYPMKCIIKILLWITCLLVKKQV